MGMKDKATNLGMKVMNDIMTDPEKAQKLAKAMGAYQKGRDSVRESQEKLLHSVGLPTTGDVEGLTKRISKVRRRIKDVSKRLGKVQGRLA